MIYGNLTPEQGELLAEALREEAPAVAAFLDAIPEGFHPYISFRQDYTGDDPTA